MNTTIYSPKMKTSSGWQNQENIFYQDAFK